MKVSVFGVGYVGTVLAACMAEEGHEVIAVDISAEKVRAINAGETPISEPGYRRSSKGPCSPRGSEQRPMQVTPFTARSSASFASAPRACITAISICATSCKPARTSLGRLLSSPPITCWSSAARSCLARCGDMWFRCCAKSRGRSRASISGSLITRSSCAREARSRIFGAPAVAVIGSLDERTGEVLTQLNEGNGAEIHTVDMGTAEAIKYANNSWHASK